MKEQDKIDVLLMTKANRLEGLREGEPKYSKHIVESQAVVQIRLTKGTSKGGHQDTYDSSEWVTNFHSLDGGESCQIFPRKGSGVNRK